MPLFGKKKDSEEKKAYPTQPGSGYPTQPASGYPPQPGSGYPAQHVAPQQAYTTYAAPPGAMGGYPAAPPPYAPPGQAPPTFAPQTGYPQPGPYPQAQPGGYPGQQHGPNTTYVVSGGFDAGARFDGNTPPSIPPPPPGCAPNVAQVASSQGSNVQITQREGNWITGGSDGGYTVW